MPHFTDFRTLYRDMAQYARDHRTANFLCADNPTTKCFGWTAWTTDENGVEHTTEWEITVDDMKRCARREHPGIERRLLSAQGRRDMLLVMISEARMPVAVQQSVPKTIWERLEGDE
jgi:hypothetical protein